MIVSGTADSLVGGRGHHCDLRVPGAPAGSPFTVRVRPSAPSTHAIYAVLQIRG